MALPTSQFESEPSAAPTYSQEDVTSTVGRYLSQGFTPDQLRSLAYSLGITPGQFDIATSGWSAPAPAYESPLPTYQEYEEPAYEPPAPTYESPLPAPSPQPVYEDLPYVGPVYQQPVYEPPAPAYEPPTYESPLPVYEPPAPAYVAPEPVYEPPVYEQPVPVPPAPVYEPPVPAYVAPEPVTAPTYSQQDVTAAVGNYLQQGYTPEQLADVALSQGITQEQFDTAVSNYTAPTTSALDPAVTPAVTETDAATTGVLPQETVAAAPTTQATTKPALDQAASASPQALFTTLLGADPNLADQLRANYNQAFNQGEGSTFHDPGMQAGDYTLRSLPISYDFTGERQGGGFQATKTATNDRNLPLETTYTYDDSGAITGAEVRYFTGSDSGVTIRFDGQGNKIDERGFDYSESWKGAVAPLVSMAAMAFAGPVAQSLAATIGGGSATLASNIAANAIVRGGLGAAQAGLAGGDVLTGALTGAATGALGAGGASLANTAAAETLNLTGSQIAADAVRGAVQSGLNAVPGVIASGGDLSNLGQAALVGGLTSGAGSAITSSLEGTGITGGQVSAGLRLAQELSSGKPNISAIADAAAGLVNNPNATVAAKAVGLLNTIQKAGSNPAAWMGVMEAANQLSSAVERASVPSGLSDAATSAFLAAKRTGATDEEAAAAAQAVSGGTVAGISRLPETAPTTSTQVTGGDLQTTGLSDSDDLLSVLEGTSGTIPAAATTGAAATTEPTGAAGAKVIPGWGRDGNFIQGFNNATIGTTNQARAAEILRGIYGDALDWVDQNTINAAASYVYANREDLLRQDLAQGNVLGIGNRGPSTKDIETVQKDYIVEDGRVAGPAERGGETYGGTTVVSDVGYDANGVPISVVRNAPTVEGKRLTKEERDRYDFEKGLIEARKQFDPETGQSLAINPVTGKEMTFEDFQASDTLRETIRGLSAPVMKGAGEMIRLAGTATGSEALTQAGANLEAQGRSITPEIVRQGTNDLLNDLKTADGWVAKGGALVNAVVTRPLETLAAVADIAGTNLIQEVVPFGASFAAGKAVSGAMKARFGELVSQRAGAIAGVTANASSDALEAGLATGQQVYDDLRAQGFSHERASQMAFNAGAAAAVIEAVASKVGEGPLMNSLFKNVPGSVMRTTFREGVAELPAGYLQTAIGDIATNRLGTYDPNAAQIGAITEVLAGGPVAGTIQAGGNLILTPATTAGTTTAGTTAGATTAGTTATGITAPVTTIPGTTTPVTTTTQAADTTSIVNDYVATVLGGGDASQTASTSVGDIITNAATTGADVSEATTNAVSNIITAAASTGADVASVTSSSVSGAVSAAVTSGADVAAVTQGAVSSAVTSAVTSGLDTTSAVTSAVGGAVTSAVNSGADVASTVTSAVNSAVTSAATSGADVTTAVNSAVGSAVTSAVTSGADVTSTVTSAVGSAVTSAVTNGSDATAAVTNAVNSSVSSAVTSAASTGADVTSTITASVDASVGSAVTSAVTSGANATTAVTDAVASSVTSAVTSAASSGSDVTAAVAASVDASVTSAITAAADSGADVVQSVAPAVSASVTSAVTAAVESGADTSAAVTSSVASAVNSAVTSAVDSGADVTAAVTSAVSTAVDSAVTSAVNTGTDVSTAVSTAVSSAVDSAVTSAVNAGSDVNTAINTSVSTAVDSAVNVATNTGTDVNVAISSAVTSSVESAVNAATNAGTDVSTAITNSVAAAVSTAVESGVSTETAVNAAVDAVVNVGVNTSTAIDLVNEVVKTLPPKGEEKPVVTTPEPEVAPPEPKVTPPTTTPTTTTTTTTKPATPKVSTPSGASMAAALPAFFGGGQEMSRLAPQMLEAKVTQGYVDPLARLRQAQEQFERDVMIQNLDPRLMQILSERMGAPQGGLGQAANEQPYYSYGQEDSIDDILGGSLPEAVNYAKGGYVEPLQVKEGGMALPILAKEGGLPTHKGRENFKDGKHVAGEGDGQSDDIPAWLADGEFVFPADVVSALGNGSTKAGTDKLYEMMHGIRERARSKGPKDLPPPALKSPLDYLKSKR